MKRRVFLFLTLAALAGGGVFAQTHFVPAEVNFLGGGARYEYVLNPYFTVGGYVYYNYMPTPFLDEKFCIDLNIFGAGIAARWYPGGRKFFMEFGFGYSSFSPKYREYNREYDEPIYDPIYGTYYYGFTEIPSDITETFPCFSIVPGFGWTIDIGGPGGLFISPSIKIPWFFTESRGSMGLGKGTYLSGVISFGIGYAF